MQCFQLNPLFPEREVWIELVTDLKNASELRQSSITGDLQACLINPEHVLDPFQILVAANKAIHNDRSGKMKTRSLHSELLFNLSPTNKISSSLNRFGINGEATKILVVVLGSEADAKSVMSRVDGKPVNLEQLCEVTNKAKIRDVYKLTEYHDNLLGSVLTAMAVKDLK